MPRKSKPAAVPVTADATQQHQHRRDLQGTARGGAFTLFGSGISSVMGFALTFVLAYQLGPQGSGVVQQTIAVFMMALALARLGMDTAAVWLVPRLRKDDPAQIRGACVDMLACTFVAGSALSALWWLSRWILGGPDPERERTVSAISAISWSLPVASVMLVALAATRGFGGVVPFNLIGS
ncbi:MAG: hypothetical protein ACRCYQ_11870, partial [Nocardioides sp.]